MGSTHIVHFKDVKSWLAVASLMEFFTQGVLCDVKDWKPFDFTVIT
jgi:hypothetical protein